MTRTEQCACGGYIRAESLATSRQAVAIHNLTLPHLTWRLAQGIHTPSLGGPDDPRRRWPTADDTDSCDVVQGEVGASTGGVEGAA
jgi:hypothetical protein